MRMKYLEVRKKKNTLSKKLSSKVNWETLGRGVGELELEDNINININNSESLNIFKMPLIPTMINCYQ